MTDAQPSPKIFKSPAIHRTPLYRAYAAYYGMLARCENADGKNPSYVDVKLRMTLDEWVAWSVPRYEKFIEKNPGISPSVSRFGDIGDYEIGNIEIISFVDNRAKQKFKNRLRPDGTKPCAKCERILPQNEFSKRTRNFDGLDQWCKSCSNQACRDYRKKKRTLSSAARADAP
jgi:hypothetical protein